VARLEDVLELYAEPLDETRPVVCMDEQPPQLLAETRTPLVVAAGQPARFDYAYVRAGVCSLWMFVEPLAGWRQVTVTARRARSTDWGAIAAEATKTPGALFALGAPEIVFEFYLDTPVRVARDYATFARRPEATDLLIPARKLSELPQLPELRQVADGLVAGQPFALLRKASDPQ